MNLFYTRVPVSVNCIGYLCAFFHFFRLNIWSQYRGSQFRYKESSRKYVDVLQRFATFFRRNFRRFSVDDFRNSYPIMHSDPIVGTRLIASPSDVSTAQLLAVVLFTLYFAAAGRRPGLDKLLLFSSGNLVRMVYAARTVARLEHG